MFFVKDLQHVVNLQPSQFTYDVEEQLKRRLLAEVEGSFSGRFGYIVSVVDIVSIAKGLILPSMGAAQFTITYSAIVFKPYKGEVLDAQVTQVNQKGLMASVGPTTIFVSRYMIPDSFSFNPSGVTTCFADDLDNRIERGSKIRLQILGTQTYPTKIVRSMIGDNDGLACQLTLVSLPLHFELRHYANELPRTLLGVLRETS